MKIFHVSVAILLILPLFTCMNSTTTQSKLQMSDSQAEQEGYAAYQEATKDLELITDPQINDYVYCVTGALVDAIPNAFRSTDKLYLPQQWEVNTFNEDSANAFALPGGYIAVYTGIFNIATTPDMLAAVIGHEMGHVLLRHGNEKLGTIKVFGRKQEREADRAGVALMAAAGYDPNQSVEFWKSMIEDYGKSGPSIFSTHPSDVQRIADIKLVIKYLPSSVYEGAVRPNCVTPSTSF